MKECVDKEIRDGKVLQIAQIYENFSRIFREGEGKYVGCLVFVSVGAVEPAHESAATEN